MMFEIERKFLVDQARLDLTGRRYSIIEQCYLGDTGDWAVRGRAVLRPVTIFGRRILLRPQWFMTLKKRVSNVTNIEIETKIDSKAYRELVETCGHALLVKRRYRMGRWEIDVFGGAYDGLVIAEIELRSEDEPFDRPDWLSMEVTGDIHYTNADMANRSRQP